MSNNEVEPGEPVEQLARSSIGRNIAQLFASQVVTWSMTLIIAVIVPRYLGPASVGQLRLASSLWVITQVIIGLGTSMYLTLAISRDRVRGLVLLGPILVVRTLAFVASSLVLGGVVSASRPDREFVAIMVLTGVGVLFATWSEAIGAAFLGLERTASPALAAIVSRTIGMLATIGVVLAGGTAAGIVAVGAASGALGLAMVATSLLRVTRIRFRGWWPQSRSIVRGSVAFMLAAVLVTTYREIDIVIMSVLVDREVLGWYGTADQLFGTSLFLVTIVMSSIFPVLGRLHADDPRQFVSLVQRSYGSLLVASVPIGLGIVLIAPKVVPLLFGQAFEPAAQVLVVYGMVSPLTFGAILFATVALTTGRQGFWNIVMVIGIVLTIPLDLIFIPWADRVFSNGAVGGAMAYFVTEGFMFAIGLVKICPFLMTRPVVWRTARTLLAGGVMFVLAWPFRESFLAVPVLVAVVVYVAAIVVLRVVTDDERAMVGRVLERVGMHTRWTTVDTVNTGPPSVEQ